MKDSELQAIKKRYNIVGNCDALNHALDVALQVAPTDLSVLIVGESGVGKEIIPRLIHDQSPRRREKYFAINCGSIPEGTIDSELFGHIKGSFTGAINDSPGYFGAANKGTLFLDEVGELPLSTQARLLRVLETGEYISVGATEVKKTDVRIVAATNVNMARAISESEAEKILIPIKRCGIYTDDNGNKHIVSNICPHMKCNLIFNYIDKTWDCPCHGSRFTEDGEVGVYKRDGI